MTTLLLLVRAAGREEPQVFSIKVVPSPFLIVRWSRLQVKSVPIPNAISMSNAVICNEMMSPSSTSIISVVSILLG